MRHVLALALGVSAGATAASANDEREAFVEANILGIFYHELGHALIDLLELPVFGQEEDAADVASILLIDALYDEETAQSLAYDAAFGFLGEVELGGDVIYWDVHGPDEQRFYNTVCLFYGANPDEREDFALDMELPEERAIGCEEEFALANDSWGPALGSIAGQGNSISFDAGGLSGLTVDLMTEEVAALNADFVFPSPLAVRVERCGEANAFFDLDADEIIMCVEFEDHLREIFDLFG